MSSASPTATAANEPGPGLGHDLEAVLAGDVGQEPVSRVGQPVEVEGACQGAVGGDGQRGGQQGRERAAGLSPGQADQSPDGPADQGEIGHAAGRRWGRGLT